MSRLESIRFKPMRATVADGTLTWEEVPTRNPSAQLSQVFWYGKEPWREANLWLMERLTEGGVSPKTVESNASAMHAYAIWLEENQADWRHFPLKKRERVIWRYRGALMDALKQGRIAPSTAKQRINVLIQFYRWAKENDVISPDGPLWTERTVSLRFADPTGFDRTFSVRATDLSIHNRKQRGEGLEDGVLPVTLAARDEILQFAQKSSSRELFLILAIGFYTGMRIGTICDLKVATIMDAVSEPWAPDLFRLSVGPGASPAVSTKHGVTGQILIPRVLLDQLRAYAVGSERIGRQAIAAADRRDILFLTRFGNSYTQRGSDRSAAINVEMHRLRMLARVEGPKCLSNFNFHQTRATFATCLAQLAIAKLGVVAAVAFVRDALLHARESTTLRYIKFVEKQPIKEELANEFTNSFMGLSASFQQCPSS